MLHKGRGQRGAGIAVEAGDLGGERTWKTLDPNLYQVFSDLKIYILFYSIFAIALIQSWGVKGGTEHDE